MKIAKEKMRLALAAWEIGRNRSGFGAKAGGLGVVVEELPPELVKVAAEEGIKLEVETLSPCFAHYDRSKMSRLPFDVHVTLDGNTFPVAVYERIFREPVTFADGDTRLIDFRMVYFWDDWLLNWTSASALYPSNPFMAVRLYSAMSQAMADYIRQSAFDVVHLHDYHVGLIPFYLSGETLARLPVHFTIHNASYQGTIPVAGRAYQLLDSLDLPGAHVFHKYFDFFGDVNLMKGTMLRVHETGGRITTVSGNLEGTWGYAAELKQSMADLVRQAWAQKGGPPGEVFLPNRHLDLFEWLPILGITNGMSERNRAEHLPELKAEVLRTIQERQGPHQPLFGNPSVQDEMLARDHNFSPHQLDRKMNLRKLLMRETFGYDFPGFPILLSVVGRLVDQKNLGLVADIIEPVLAYDNQVKFIVLVSADANDAAGKQLEQRFAAIAARFPGQVAFDNTFNQPLSKLILAGSDLTLIPSRFEPCGLVDYEAALLGTIPVAHATGGLVKTGKFSYLYHWLDVSDRQGEARAFFQKIKEAIDVIRYDYAQHVERMRHAMATDVSWARSARQYLMLFRESIAAKFARS